MFWIFELLANNVFCHQRFSFIFLNNQKKLNNYSICKHIYKTFRIFKLIFIFRFLFVQPSKVFFGKFVVFYFPYFYSTYICILIHEFVVMQLQTQNKKCSFSSKGSKNFHYHLLHNSTLLVKFGDTRKRFRIRPFTDTPLS